MRARRLWGSLGDGPPPAARRGLLPAILAGCFLLRLATAWLLPSIHQADEVYQVAEQAHRSVHGYGIVSWEFRTGSRAALFPALVQPIFRLDASVETRHMLVASVFSALSLLPVWVAFEWVRRLHGAAAGVLAAVMTATWFELAYFGPKPTPDAVSGYLLVAALFLARPGASRAAVFAAGFLLLLAAGVRMQIVPAVGLALVLAGAVAPRERVLPLVAGAVAALAIVGGVEWAWWGVPFGGHIGYLRMEFVHRASTYFSREPITFFVKNYVLIYGGLVPIVLALLYAGARRAPILLACAAAVVVPFHFVGHKEYRFLMPAVPQP